MTTVAPHPVDLFINQVAIEYDADITGCKRGHPYTNYVRPTTMFILWKFYGLSIENLAAKFGVRTQGVYYNIRVAQEQQQEQEKILTIFIDTMKRFINLNKQKDEQGYSNN